MAIAPLHGRSAPLWLAPRWEPPRPRLLGAALRHAPFSTRARRARRRRLTRTVLAMLAVAGAIALATCLTAWWMRG